MVNFFKSSKVRACASYILYQGAWNMEPKQLGYVPLKSDQGLEKYLGTKYLSWYVSRKYHLWAKNTTDLFTDNTFHHHQVGGAYVMLVSTQVS